MKALTLREFAAADPLATSPPGRVCAAPGCETHLSVYNHGIYCTLHEDGEELRPPYRRCLACGIVKNEAAFTSDRTRRDGRLGICRACRGKRDRASYRRLVGGDG